MARPAGLEPAAYRLGTDCSIQLSYGRVCVLWTIVEVRGQGLTVADGREHPV